MNQINSGEDKNERNSHGNNRWWEFYGVRYAMGTVVGGIIAYELFDTSTAIKMPFLSMNGGMTLGQVIILAAYGLTYCYIASAPILVFHATRFVFLESRVYKYFKKRLKLIGLAFIFTNTIMVITLLLKRHPPNRISEHILVILVLVELLLPLCLFVFYQLLLIEKSLNAESTNILERYIKLAEKRSTDKSGFVESYRHLREHGNSFAIVILEIVLGLLLFLFINIPVLNGQPNYGDGTILFFLILLLWIMPAAFVWVLSLNLEKEYIDKAQT